MALPTFVPPVRPSPGTTHKPAVSILEAEFGDGYSQPTPKGINHIKKSTTLKWAVLTTEQADEIEDFFERMGGTQPFYFHPFGVRSMMKWTCKDWERTTEGGIWQISATLVQSFTSQK